MSGVAPGGQAVRVHPGRAQMLGPQYPFRQHGRAASGFRTDCRCSGRWWTRCASSSRCTRTSSIMVPRSCSCTRARRIRAAPVPERGPPADWAPENQNLPGFIVLTSGGKNPDAGKSVWGSGYLPSVYQGVQCRSQGIRCCFCPIPPASRAVCGGGRWTRCMSSTSARRRRWGSRDADPHRAI